MYLAGEPIWRYTLVISADCDTYDPMVTSASVDHLYRCLIALLRWRTNGFDSYLNIRTASELLN
jgi:hypothetical protein